MTPQLRRRELLRAGGAESSEQLTSFELDDLLTGFALSGDRLFVAKRDEIFALGP